MVLQNFLEPSAKADEGYLGHPNKIKCPGNDVHPAGNGVMQGKVRVHHKMVNGQLKTWWMLSQVFCHHITMYGDVFWACAVVMQLSIENGEPLFEVEYTD
jgi:hypothetical protein